MVEFAVRQGGSGAGCAREECVGDLGPCSYREKDRLDCGGGSGMAIFLATMVV